MDPSRAIDTNTGFREFSFNDEDRLMFEGGLDVSTRRTHEFDPWFDRYERMRLVYEPILQYGYFNPSVDLEEITAGNDVRFPYIDPVDAIRFKMHRVSALFRTRVEGKDQANITSDFLNFTSGFEFDQLPDENLLIENFEFFDDLAENDDHRFSDFLQTFNIFPYSWLSFGNNLRWDIEDGVIRSAFYYSNIQPIERLKLTAGLTTFRYPVFESEEEQDVSLSVIYDVSSKWQLSLSGRYDIDESELRRVYASIMRDLYDFYALFQIEHETHPTLGDNFGVSFSLQFWGIEGRQGQNQPGQNQPTPIF